MAGHWKKEYFPNEPYRNTFQFDGLPSIEEIQAFQMYSTRAREQLDSTKWDQVQDVGAKLKEILELPESLRGKPTYELRRQGLIQSFLFRLYSESTPIETQIRLGNSLLGFSEETAKRLPSNPRTKRNLALQYDHLSRLYSLVKESSASEREKAVVLAKKATSLRPDVGTYWNTLGVALYRQGDYYEAIRLLLKSIEMRKGGDPNDFFFLAMAHFKLGNKEESKQWYDKGVKWMADRATRIRGRLKEELESFQKEAAQLLELPVGIQKTPVEDSDAAPTDIP